MFSVQVHLQDHTSYTKAHKIGMGIKISNQGNLRIKQKGKIFCNLNNTSHENLMEKVEKKNYLRILPQAMSGRSVHLEYSCVASEVSVFTRVPNNHTSKVEKKKTV